MIVLGIDPGLSGALASWNGETLITLEVPTFKAASRGKEVDWATLAFNVDLMFPEVDHAFIERVSSRPKEGVASAFKFGYVCGGLRGLIVARGVPLTLVTPLTWKRAMGLGTAGKDAAVARATQLFPIEAGSFRGPKGGIKDGVAEAALIAYYGHSAMSQGAKKS